MTTSAIDSPATPALGRALDVWQVSIAGIGVILGAGVYAIIGPATAEAGNAVWLACRGGVPSSRRRALDVVLAVAASRCAAPCCCT